MVEPDMKGDINTKLWKDGRMHVYPGVKTLYTLYRDGRTAVK
jgi:hypothetical protein